MLRLKTSGRVTISRPSGSEGSYISITIMDEPSGCQVVEARMTLADFAGALTGMGRSPAELETIPGAPIGKRLEVKEVPVFIPGGASERDQSVALKAIAEHEVDGWVGSTSNVNNHHYTTYNTVGPSGEPGRTVRVRFSRHVDPSHPSY